MLSYVLRRLVLAVFTVFGVMVLTFLLFRGVAGDIAAAHVGAKGEDVDAGAKGHLGSGLDAIVGIEGVHGHRVADDHALKAHLDAQEVAQHGGREGGRQLAIAGEGR